MKIYLLIFALASLCSAQDPSSLNPKIPEYFGAGYDILSGNPLSKDVDPGFKAKQLFEYTYDESSTDGKFYYPLEVTVNLLRSCERKFDSAEINGLKSYHDSLEVAAKVSGGYDGLISSVSFTASADYKTTEEELSTENKIRILTQERCKLYKVGLNSNQKLSQDFLGAVENAVLLNDWKRLIEEWGTHYASELVMGASVIRETVFERTTVQQLESAGINIEAAVSGSYRTAEAALETHVELSTEQQSYFENAHKEIHEYYIGVSPPVDSDNQTWLLEIENAAPLPITFTLEYIGDLFNNTGFSYFGDKYTKEELDEMSASFTDTLHAIINGTISARVPLTDTVPSNLTILTSTSVIIGGMGGSQFEDPSIRNFYFKPQSIEVRSADVIDAIRLVLSDGVTTQITEWHGGLGGNSDKYIIPENKRVAKVQIWVNWVVTGLMFINDDGTYSQVFGKQNGDLYEVDIYGYLTGFRGRSAEYVDALGFTSNEYSYDPSNPLTVPVATFLYGGDGGSFFLDQLPLSSTDPYLNLRATLFVDNIMLTTTQDGTAIAGSDHGGGGGSPYETSLVGLQAIRIRSAKYVDALQFNVDGVWGERYGGDGGDESNLDVPSNQTLVGIYGRSADFVDAIGFIFAYTG